MNPALIILILALIIVSMAGESFGFTLGSGGSSGSDLTDSERATCGKMLERLQSKEELSIGSVSVAQKLAMLYNESGVYIARGDSNSQVIGDAGHSVGFCQVSQPAINEVNSYLNTNYSKQQCLESEHINFVVGFTYLDLCLKSALNQGSVNAVKLAFKKYNGGIDETDISTNLMAQNYANKAYKFYIYFSDLERV